MHENNLPEPLLLAYLGDSVLEVMVRRYLVSACRSAAECNQKALLFVTAKAQSEAAKNMLPFLTDGERELFARFKNAKSPSNPRNVDLYSYRLATGLEAMFGYWYLCGKKERMEEIFSLVFLKKEGASDGKL